MDIVTFNVMKASLIVDFCFVSLVNNTKKLSLFLKKSRSLSVAGPALGGFIVGR